MTDIKSNLKKIPIRKLAKYLGGLVGFLFVGMIGLLFYLDTQTGRNQITRYINNVLKSDDSAITISKLEGALYSEILIPKISFTDRDGEWLEIESAKIYWSLGDLFNGRLSVAQLRAEQVNFMRNPTGANAKETDADLFAIPALPFDIYIDRFEINRINISENIADKLSVFTASGALTLTESDGILTRFNLLTKQVADDKPAGDQVLVDVSYPGTGAAVNVDIGLNAPEDGLFVALSGLEPRQSISVHFNGTGPIDNWHGKLEARANSKVFAMAGVNYRNGEFSLQSNFDPTGFVGGEMVDLFGNANSLELVLTPTDKEDLSELKFQYQAKILTLNANGTLSTEDSVLADGINFKVELNDPDPLNKMISPGFIKPSTIKGRVDNPLQSPKITFDLEGLELGQKDKGEVSLSALLSGHFETLFDNGKIINSSNGKLVSIKMQDGGKVQALVDKSINWSAGLKFDPATSLLSIDNISVDNEFAKLAGSGAVNSTDGKVTGAVTTVLDNITVIAEKMELSPVIAGRAEISVNLSRANFDSPLSASLDLKTTGLDLGNKLVNEIIGNHPTFKAKIRQNAEGAITLSDTVLNGAYTSLNAAGELSAGQEFEHSGFTLSISDMDQIESLEGTALSGKFDINGSLEGDMSAPKVVVETAFNKLDIQGIELENFKAQLTANDIMDAPKAQLTLSSTTSIGDLSLSSGLTSGENGYKIEDFNIILGAFEANGSVELPMDKPLTGSIFIITDENKNHPPGVEGVITAKIDMTDQENIQNIAFDGRVDNLFLPLSDHEVLSIKSAKINGEARLPEQKPDFKVSAEIEKLMHPLIQVEQASISASQNDKDLSFNLIAAGEVAAPYHVTLNGSSTENLNDILVTLEGDIDQTKINLSDPAHILRSDKAIELLPFNLKIGEGEISGQFKKDENDIAGKLALKNTDIRPFSLLFQDRPMVGRVNGQFDLDGKDNLLSGSFSLKVSNLSLESYRSLREQMVELTASGTISNDALDLSGTYKEDGLNKADYSATLPLDIDLAYSKYGIDTEKPFAATLNWDNDIGSIWPMFNLASDDLRGQLAAKLNFGGTLSNPDLDGSLRFLNGHYENLKAGFVADNINVDAAIQNRQITLENFNATDGEEGKISANGAVKLDEKFNYTADATLKLINAHLVRQPELQIVASSDLSFVKNETGARLSGKIVVDNASIGAIEQSAPEIVQLDVREINSDGMEIDNNNQTVKPINLDLILDVPGKLFIRSYGLDSEWKADLAVSGTSEAPLVSGTASLIRGFFEFSGKRFILTRGNLTFPDDGSNDPIADVVAEHRLSDLLAKLDITGRVSKPTIKMSSDPYLPENELMARILFGTSVSELSAVELVQLASAVHSMSNGGGQGFMGGIRNAIGIDRLSIDNDPSREYGTTITGGKYLTNNVYVEVSTAPATGETSTAVEVDLTKSLSLVTKRTLDHDNSLSIRWSWDY